MQWSDWFSVSSNSHKLGVEGDSPDTGLLYHSESNYLSNLNRFALLWDSSSVHSRLAGQVSAVLLEGRRCSPDGQMMK